MLLDRVRDDAFLAAITSTVRPGDVVLDFGAGAGILSLFAARAGAKRIFAVEKTETARLARQIVARNDLGDRITVIQSDMEAAMLPERVDVIVSEWLGTIGVDENLLSPLLTARDRWLRANGRMIPERVTAWMAPVSHAETSAQRLFYGDRPYGFDFSPAFETWPNEAAWSQHPLEVDSFVAGPLPLWTIDVYSFSAEQARLPFRSSPRFHASRYGEIDGLALWFEAQLATGIRLTNAPGSPSTHWMQYVLPLQRAVSVRTGTEIAVDFACIPSHPGYCHQAWSVRVGSGSWQHHDTRSCYPRDSRGCG
jgi:precorrin-6B methylase 2